MNYALHGLIILYLLYLSEKGAGTRQLMELEFNPSPTATTRSRSTAIWSWAAALKRRPPPCLCTCTCQTSTVETLRMFRSAPTSCLCVNTETGRRIKAQAALILIGQSHLDRPIRTSDQPTSLPRTSWFFGGYVLSRSLNVNLVCSLKSIYLSFWNSQKL